MQFRRLILALSLLGVSELSLAAVLKVPGDYSTIQAGIDATNSGDTVLVADGTYTGDGNYNLDPMGKTILMMSENGPERCIIDCEAQSQRRGFYCHTEETPSTKIEGFSIINGRGDSPGGGGIRCSGSSPVIKNCIFKNNSVGMNGGAILCESSDAFISNCKLMNNSADYGGGLHCNYGAVTIENCTFTNNSADGRGGGIILVNSSSHITDSEISNNAALNNVWDGWGGLGGGIYVWDSDSSIDNCIIIGNAADRFGGGIFTHGTDSPVIMNCTFETNSAILGGGVFCSDHSSPIIGGSQESSNVFIDNSAMAGADLCADPDSDSINASFNQFEGFSLSDYYVSPQSKFDLTNSISSVQPIEQDVYVSPQGDDSNDGLTMDTPFKTIIHAARNIFSSESNPVSIHLLPGVYSPSETGENFPLPLVKGVNIAGDDPQSVLLDAEGEVHVFFGYFDENSITGISITGGTQGGIKCLNSSIQLTDCIIKENSCVAQDNEDCKGGGISALDSNLRIAQCVIENNTTGNSGGGIYFGQTIFNSSFEFLMENSTIRNNTAYYGGGGVYCLPGFGNDNAMEITGCHIINNISSMGAGGGVYIYGKGIISDCEISGNTCNDGGGGIILESDETIVVQNCIVADNSADTGGIYLTTGFNTDIRISNCTIVRNSSSAGDTGGIHISSDSSYANTDITNCIIWKNASHEIYTSDDSTLTVSYSCIRNGYTGDGNIAFDPAFQGDQDFHLKGDSPCIDMGTITGAPETDMEGNPRPQGGRVDMGAYEFAGWPEVPRPYIQMSTRYPGIRDLVSCTVSVWNPGSTLVDYPLFVILDVFGYYYFAPDFNEFSYYSMTFPEGLTPVTVLPEFAWPVTIDPVWGVVWYAALTNPQMTALYGNMDTLTFGWHCF